MLEHHGAIGTRPSDFNAIALHGAARTVFKSCQNSKQGGFAATGSPDQRDKFTILDREINVLQGWHRIGAWCTKNFTQLMDVNLGHGLAFCVEPGKRAAVQPAKRLVHH